MKYPIASLRPNSSNRCRSVAQLVFAAMLAIGGASTTTAATQYWSGSGTWNTTNLNWSAPATPGGPYGSAWANTTVDIAVFEGTAGTVAIGGNLNVDVLNFNVTGYDLAAAAPVNLTGAGATNVNLLANVTAGIGANVNFQSSGGSQNWNLAGGNKTTSILNVSGTIRNATANSSLLRDMTVNVNSGGQLISLSSIVTGTGTTGSGSDLNVSGGTVSIGGTGTSLILNNTGAITATSSITVSGSGAITFTDATNTGGLRFGPTGGSTNAATNLTGIFSLDGGTVTVNKVFMGGNFTGGASYDAAFYFNGGTLKALRNAADFMTGLAGTGAIVESGGAKIDSNGKEITIAQALLDGGGNGGLTKEGTGTLTLTGTNTYTGDTTINGGKLAISAPYSFLTDTVVNNTGRLKIISSGTSPSVLNALTLNSGGGIECDFGVFNPANQPALDVGTLNANANYTIDIAGSSIPSGVTVTLLTYTGKSGAGQPIIGNLPAGMTLTSGPTDTGNSIEIVVNTGTAASFSWSKGDGDWDAASFNWNGNTVAYAEPAIVSFPDLAEPGNGVNEVAVVGSRAPFAMTLTNTGDFDTNAYAFSGSGSISGNTGITKSGVGLLTFNNSNSYSGTLAITGGSVVKTAADTTTGPITVADSASFVLHGGVTDGSGQTITIAGPGQAANYFYTGSLTQRGSLQSQAGDNTWEGNIILTGTAGVGGNTRIGVQNGSSLTLNGNITEGVVGMSPLFRAGNSPADNITINGLCSWTGITRLFSEGGAIVLGGDDRFPTNAQLSAGSTASPGFTVFDLAGNDQTVAGLTGDGSGRIRNSGGASVLTSNPTAAVTFSGIMEDDVSFVIGGTAIQSLAGDNRYSGDTMINSGGSLTVTATGELRFYPTTNGTNNAIGGSGTLQFDGTLRLDLAGADTTVGNSWTLLDQSTLTVNFGGAFSVADATLGTFSESFPGSGIWELTDSGKKWTFTRSDGKLTVANALAGYAAWQAANAPGQAVYEDHDNDGVQNGVEYFMGESGSGFTANPGIVGNVITWPMGGAYTGVFGTDYLVQTSDNLEDWLTATLGVGPGFVVVNPGTSVVFTLPAPADKLFVRLLVKPD